MNYISKMFASNCDCHFIVCTYCNSVLSSSDTNAFDID